MLDKGKVAELKGFIGLLEKNPHLINSPDLAFFRKFMEQHGASFDVSSDSETQPSGKSATESCASATTKTDSTPVDEPVISDDEPESEDDEEKLAQEAAESLAKDRLMQPETVPPPEKAPETSSELTDEEMEQIAQLRSEAAEAIQNNDLELALQKLNEVVARGPASSLVYGKRAELLLSMERPLACIKDCTNAIEVNGNYGKAYRIRGRAYRALGDWFQAHRDIEMAQQLDYDPDLTTLQGEIAERWKILDAAKRTKQRRRDEVKSRNANRQRRRRQAEARRIYNEQKAAEAAAKAAGEGFGGSAGFPGAGFPGGFPGGAAGGAGGGFPGGFPGGAAGGAGGAAGMGEMYNNLIGNPDIKKAMENPKILSALVELMQNPSAINKYKDDPEVMQALNSLRGSAKPGQGEAGMPGDDVPF